MFCERGVISAVDAKMDRDENHNKINTKRIFLNKNKFVILPKKMDITLSTCALLAPFTLSRVNIYLCFKKPNPFTY